MPSRSNTTSAPIARASSRRSAGAPMTMTVAGAGEPRERDRAQPDRAGALHDDGVAEREARPLDDVHRRQQSAAAADVVVERDGVRQPRDDDARLEVDLLRPAAEQPFGGRIGDAVDAPRGQRVGVRCTVHARQRPQVRCTSKNATRSPSRSACRRCPSSGPRIAVERAGRDVPGDDRIRHAGQAAVPQVHIGAAHFGSRGPQQRGARRQIGTREFANLDRLRAAPGMTAARMRSLTAYGNLGRTAADLIRVLDSMDHQLTTRARRRMSHRAACGFRARCCSSRLLPRRRGARRPTHRNRGVSSSSVSYESFATQTLHFERFPLEDLVGGPVGATQFKSYDYETRDGSVLIDVLNFTRRGHGAGITLYPFGASVGPTLALRAGVQDLPDIRIAFAGTGAPQNYELAGARAYDVGAALVVADHSRGWGLGSQAFVGGGRRTNPRRDPHRRSLFRRRRRRPQFRTVRGRAVRQVRVESHERPCRSPFHHRAGDASRHAHFLT